MIARWTQKAPKTPQIPASPQVAVDRTVIDELRAMVGDAVCDTLLSKFAAEVDRRLKNMRETPDRISLGAEAKALISKAGSLGFVGFSNLCRDLESVARKDGDLDILHHGDGDGARFGPERSCRSALGRVDAKARRARRLHRGLRVTHVVRA